MEIHKQGMLQVCKICKNMQWGPGIRRWDLQGSLPRTFFNCLDKEAKVADYLDVSNGCIGTHLLIWLCIIGSLNPWILSWQICNLLRYVCLERIGGPGLFLELWASKLILIIKLWEKEGINIFLGKLCGELNLLLVSDSLCGLQWRANS